MKNILFNFFKKNKAEAPAEKKESATVHTEFTDSVIFEENPFINEEPDNVSVYTLDGKEVPSNE